MDIQIYLLELVQNYLPEPVQFVPVVNTLHPFDVAQIFVPVKTLARQSGRTP